MKEADTKAERALLTAAAEGNRDAFCVLVRKYLRDVYRFAWAMSGDEYAERVTENAFVTAWHQMPYFERMNMDFRSHLLQLVCIDVRDVGSRRGYVLLWMSMVENGSVVNPSFLPLRYEPHSGMEHLTLQADIEEAVHNLPFRFRRLLLLHELSGLSPAEIGDITGVDPNTVYDGLQTAYAMIRKQILSDGGFFAPFGNREDAPRRYRACKDRLSALTAAARGLCTDAELTDLRSHMEQCRGCRDFHAALCVIQHGVRIMKRDPPAELADEIMERIGTEPGIPETRRRFRPAFGRFTIIALCIALILLVYSGFFADDREKAPSAPPAPPAGTLIPGAAASTALIPEGERYAAVYTAQTDAAPQLAQYCDFTFRATLTDGREVLYYVVPLSQHDTLAELVPGAEPYGAAGDAIDAAEDRVLYMIPLSS